MKQKLCEGSNPCASVLERWYVKHFIRVQIERRRLTWRIEVERVVVGSSIHYQRFFFQKISVISVGPYFFLWVLSHLSAYWWCVLYINTSIKLRRSSRWTDWVLFSAWKYDILCTAGHPDRFVFMESQIGLYFVLDFGGLGNVWSIWAIKGVFVDDVFHGHTRKFAAFLFLCHTFLVSFNLGWLSHRSIVVRWLMNMLLRTEIICTHPLRGLGCKNHKDVLASDFKELRGHQICCWLMRSPLFMILRRTGSISKGKKDWNVLVSTLRCRCGEKRNIETYLLPGTRS